MKQEEPKLVFERPKKSLEGSTNENPIVIVDQENTSSQSTVSSDGMKKCLEHYEAFIVFCREPYVIGKGNCNR